MTYISNDPAWWSIISGALLLDYFVVASFAVVVYDWALTFGQEFELVWKQHWSLMTLLYVCVRYVGILYSIVRILETFPVSVTDQGCTILWFVQIWTPVVTNAMLSVIMMARIHAMYQRSKKMFIFLVVFLASTIATGIMAVIGSLGVSGEEMVLSGYHVCGAQIDTDGEDLLYESVIPTTVWEILTFVLAVWIAITHFRELRQSLTKSTIGDCFMVLIKSHSFYFLAFAVVTCFDLGVLSPNIPDSFPAKAVIGSGVPLVAQVSQTFVLGPRLILSVRQYHADLVARSDEGTGMTSIAFQAGGDALAGVDVLTGGDV